MDVGLFIVENDKSRIFYDVKMAKARTSKRSRPMGGRRNIII